MKRNITIITLMFAALMMVAGPVSAAKIKAEVTSAAATHDAVCADIAQLSGTEAGGECGIDAGVTSIVILNTHKKLSLKEGQDVILKAKGTGKVMGKVSSVIPEGTDMAKIAGAVGTNGAVVIKGGKGCVAVITPEKPFAPEKGGKVTLKTKKKQTVEGC